jgi:predicted dehydrogenase
MGQKKKNRKPTKSANLSRKDFLKKSALGFASFSIVPRFVLGGTGYTAPSDKITIGFIGTGKQSTILANPFFSLPEAQFVACCDVDSIKRTKFKEWVEKKYAEAGEQTDYNGCTAYKDYKELIAHDDLDAVIVCTPDHWHAIPAIAALNAGKDLYCEKPLSLTIEEGRAMVEATRRNNRIAQTGSMQRSWDIFAKASELVRNGYLGEIKEVKVNVGGPPRAYDLPKQAIPESLNWDEWIGPSPFVVYNNEVAPPYPWDNYPRWRSFKEFGGGGVTDWGAHMFDIVQWALGMDDSGPVEFIPPKEENAQRGLKFIYANGIEVTHEDFDRGNAVRFIGSEGSLDISRQFLEPSDMSLVDHKLGAEETKLFLSDNHYQDWLDAIKNRTKPIADIEIGHRTASICNIANIAYELRRPLKWNPKTERFKSDNEANSMLSRSYRDGYNL